MAPTFYDIVVVRRTEATARLGIGNHRGVVIGIAEPETSEEDRYFAVSIGGETYMVHEDNLWPTGERVERETLYDGTSLRVTVHGEIAVGDADDS